MCGHFRYGCRSVGLLKRESSLQKVVDRSALRGEWWHMLVPIGPRPFREKSGVYEKSLEVSEILHMGVAIGKSGLACRRRPVDPPLLYHIEAGLSIGKTAQKKSLSALFFDTINNIDDGKLFVTVEAGAEFLDVFPASSAGVIHFVFFASAVRAFNFHSITTNHFQGRQGCIRPCIPQRNCHPHSSYSKPHRPWFPARSECIPHNSSTYSSS